MHRYPLVAILLLFSALRGLLQAEAPDAELSRYFEKEVLPLLQEHCFECHSGEKSKGGLRLDNRSALVSGGDSGSAINESAPEKSLLVEAINYSGIEMPPQGKLPQAKIDILTGWVAKGAPYSEGMQGEQEEVKPKIRDREITAKDRSFWSFQPISKPVPPTTELVEHPIDAFLIQRLREKGIEPNPTASPQVLIRRLHYGLLGLPPSQELVEAFAANPSQEHWNRIVDRLLATPEYGERWGRHWLDLVRYAETNSYERDGIKPEAWRYRDWVIDGFNADQPYDAFIRDQLAGDELPFLPERLIATGFYRLGIWDDEPADPLQARFDDLDDIITTTGQVFLGLTINCARCHAHKIDPISQRDYYRFAAFFAGINRFGVRSEETIARASLRALVPPAERAKHQEAWEAYQKRKRALEQQLRNTEKIVEGDLDSVEREEFVHEMNRYPLIAKRIGRLLTAEVAAAYREGVEELAELERNKPESLAMALCITERGTDPGPMHLLIRGNPHAPTEEVPPGFPEVLGGGTPKIGPSPHQDTSGRRIVLADWIAHKDNPLTARVMANRIWHYHFGRGLVRTPNDFGYQGSFPTHPELLDWLASELIRHDWQIKPLHREILRSRAYRMSSSDQPLAREAEGGLAGETAGDNVRKSNSTIDPVNDLFWRFDPRRLTAEEIRDSILSVTGVLNLKKRGPWMYPEIEPEVLAGQSRPGHGWGKSSEGERSRRSIYIHVKRSLPVPLLALFDVAEPDFTCPARFATTQPTQALGLLNSRFLQDSAAKLAKLVAAGGKDQGVHLADMGLLVSDVIQRVTQRSATKEEVALGMELIESLTKEQNLSAEEAFERFCLIALNLNEFIYLD